MVFAKRGRNNPIPFGPYLAVAGLITLMYGGPLAAFTSGVLGH
jgi:leader peptidase (prepilin peptidase)/N-methyltransferase